jgi:hypothetical protein
MMLRRVRMPTPSGRRLVELERTLDEKKRNCMHGQAWMGCYCEIDTPKGLSV